MLQAIDLECVRGGRRLFSSLDFSLGPGGLVQLTGANGSGKTSALSIVPMVRERRLFFQIISPKSARNGKLKLVKAAQSPGQLEWAAKATKAWPIL